MDETSELDIECVATGAHPEPIFKWYIGDQIYTENITTTVQTLQDDKRIYTSTFKYLGKLKDDGRILKCEVIHNGYKKQQVVDKENVVKVQLDLFTSSDKLSIIIGVVFGGLLCLVFFVVGLIFLLRKRCPR